ncbi:ABC transporter ATP-binding protein [candidate division LCP-89 bacterium B3_LCP]|uniref:ABC transporter ATP-binding protein n=1 Tax=candidate division LCP-89 bacterium B3_LCP TaxID=2012998 RepID=A0A532UVZ3_UNCL8|nr:MAG: ABC transporter ATP-binding protein [candidate division LCP-89 bacterium B3_LCP]
MPPAIQIDNLTVQFDGKIVLSDFALHLEPGEKITLTGRSGSGKSTLLKSILGFVVPERGSIHIGGRELTGSSVWELRTHMAYVAQEPLLGSGTVSEILQRPFSYRTNADKCDNLSRIPNLFDRLLLPRDLLDQDVSLVSGGEKQRIAIISADLLDRRIYLLDEASSALDEDSKHAVNEFFIERLDLSVLSVSHDPENFFCRDRVVTLNRPDGERS